MEKEENRTEEELAQEPVTQKDIDKVVRNHTLGSIGVGLIPMPIVDIVALTGVQLNMLRKLAKLYNIPFSKDKVKPLVASLIGSGLSVSMSGALASILKAIPVVGQTSSALAMPALSGAVTYAVGKVFIQHFASGGTFLDFDPEKVRAYYAEMLKEGEKVVEKMKS